MLYLDTNYIFFNKMPIVLFYDLFLIAIIIFIIIIYNF